MIRRIVLILTLCTAAAWGGEPAAPASQPNLTGNRYDFGEKQWTFSGSARFEDGDALVQADELVYDRATDTATAVGHIVFTRGAARLLADRLVYNRRTGAFSADNIRLGSYPYFVEGFSAEGTRAEITVRRARISYGEPGPWQPTVTADVVVVAPGKRIRTENAVGGIGHLQPFPFPKFQHDLSQPFAAAVSFTGGYRRSLGAFADAAVHVPVTPTLRLGADVGIFSNRGIMVGPSGRYQSSGDDPLLEGYFRSGFINDHGTKGIDLLARPVPEERAFVEWQHRQSLAPNLTLAGQLNWWKDSEVVRDFRSRNFFPVQQPDTFLESVYTGANYFVSAFARFQPNTFHRVPERLPEVRFDLLPVALGHGFYHRFSASAAILREDPVASTTAGTTAEETTYLPDGYAYYSPATTLRSNRFDAYYAMMRPIAPRDWFAVTPIAGGRLTHYANMRGVDREGSYTRVLGEFGLDAALRGSGTFAYQNPQWKIDGLRHLVTPRVSYRYMPETEEGQARIPRIDREAFSTYLQPLGLGDGRNIDDLRAAHTLRLSLDNTVQTRDREQGTRDLLMFNLANDFRFRRRPGERDVSETHIEAAFWPARWLQLDLYQSFAPQSFTLRELNSGITVRDGSAWSVRFGNNFLRNQIQDYSIEGRMRINERYEALTRLHYDARRHRFNEQAYGIAQNLGNTWLISYTVRLYSGRRRESSFGFNVEIEAIRF